MPGDQLDQDDLLDLLAGYPHGPGAPVKATERAMKRVETATAVIVVEGISDQIAIETLAMRLGRRFDTEGAVVLPVGGAQAAARYLQIVGPSGLDLDTVGFCDADGVESIIRGLRTAGLGPVESAADMSRIGFHVCRDDLEDELIRAAGTDGVRAALDSQGELGSFRTFQKQRAWHGRPVGDQLHRFLRSKARRRSRYARLLIESMDLDRAPPPLIDTLDSLLPVRA